MHAGPVGPALSSKTKQYVDRGTRDEKPPRRIEADVTHRASPVPVTVRPNGYAWANENGPALGAIEKGMAETVRFELTEGLPLRRFSRPVH